MRKLERQDILSVCDQLDALGWLSRAPGLRPTDPPRWDVNPICHAMFEGRAKSEAERRQRDRAMISEMLRGAYRMTHGLTPLRLSPDLVTTVTPQPQSGGALPQSVTIVPSAREEESNQILSLLFFTFLSRARKGQRGHIERLLERGGYGAPTGFLNA
jgi:hypothetical protein